MTNLEIIAPRGSKPQRTPVLSPGPMRTGVEPSRTYGS